MTTTHERVYRMLVAYAGTAYAGWQQQPDRPTVAGALEHALKRAFGIATAVHGASRTDAGVHALGQVASFRAALPVSTEKAFWILKNHLPHDILIRSFEECESAQYFPRHHVASKEYHYYLTHERPLPFIAPYVLYWPEPLDREVFVRALKLFEDEHDFASFAMHPGKKNTRRFVELCTAQYLARYNVLRVVVRGPGFLHNQIRRMVGAALVCAKTSVLSTELIEHALAVPDPRQQLYTAPAHGLLLRRILYK